MSVQCVVVVVVVVGEVAAIVEAAVLSVLRKVVSCPKASQKVFNQLCLPGALTDTAIPQDTGTQCQAAKSGTQLVDEIHATSP